MKQHLLTLSAVAAMFCVSVNAEPVNCNCDCHKNTNTSNVIEIGYPQRNLQNIIEIPATTKNAVEQTATQPATVNTKPATTANSQSAVYQGNVSTVNKVHFGKNISDVDGNNVVNKIGKKLMTASGIDKNIYFAYSTESTVNAQTEINGTVTVFKGIMGCCENEDELAFVIGHEIGHADGYHGAKATAVNVGLNYGANEAAKALNKSVSSKLNTFGLTKGTWTNAAVNKVQDLGNATYSKAHENDADLDAIDYMVKCGYNPLAGISILNKIGVAYPDLFADHPSTDKRVRNIYDYVKQKYPQYISQGYNTEAYQDAYKTYILQK